MAPASWERAAWPTGASLEDQDAWLIEALDYTRDVMNRLEFDLWKDATAKS